MLYNMSVSSSLTSSGYMRSSYRPISDQYPLKMRNLIERCLKKNTAERPSASELVAELRVIRDEMSAKIFGTESKESLQYRGTASNPIKILGK